SESRSRRHESEIQLPPAPPVIAIAPSDAAALAPTVELGTPAAQSGTDAADVRRVLEGARPAILDCYVREVVEGTIAGAPTVKVDWIRLTDGSLADVSGDGATIELSACVAAAVGAVHFPAPAEAGEESESFTFT